jgi:hypothetical protein
MLYTMLQVYAVHKLETWPATLHNGTVFHSHAVIVDVQLSSMSKKINCIKQLHFV